MLYLYVANGHDVLVTVRLWKVSISGGSTVEWKKEIFAVIYQLKQLKRNPEKISDYNFIWVTTELMTHDMPFWSVSLQSIAVITVEPAVKYSFVFKKYANELGSISAALSSPVLVLAHFPNSGW